ncbi:MAG: cation:proton antiporter subunit C [Thermodesulfobacteriota bacterium]
MTTAGLYLATGLAVFVLGAVGLFWHSNLIRRALALNFMATGVFLFLVALGRRSTIPFADPVPHALVLTGIVVAVSTTALLLVLICRFHETAEKESTDATEDEKGRTETAGDRE